MRFRSLDGQWTVDVIRLSLAGNNRDGECFRICRHGFFVAEARTIDELREHVDLSDLEEALTRRRARQALARSCYRQQACRQLNTCLQTSCAWVGTSHWCRSLGW
jgi:hypothetical protein